MISGTPTPEGSPPREGVDPNQWWAALGHELNGSLHALVLGVELAERLLGNDAPLARHHLEMARSNATLMQRLISDHLDAALVGADAFRCQPTAFELRSFLQRAIEMSNIGESHQVELRESTDLRVLADEDRLLQIMGNLFSNASKYSAPGALTLGAAREGACAHVWLQDGGPGMTDRERARLFQRYSRLPSKSRGLGLGLWLSRELARRMGGDLWATTVGRGSVFHLVIPLA